MVSSGSAATDPRSSTPPPHADAIVSRAYWDNDAASYAEEHADYLTDFFWCPERLREADAQLIGDASGLTIVEVGAGTAPCSRWLAHRYPSARIVAFDVSRKMLLQGVAAAEFPGNAHLLQADALAIPVVTGSADVVFSSFGAFPFIADLPAALREVKRVLHPGGKAIIASNHPMAWVFPDDPGPAGLTADLSYWQRAYHEHETTPSGQRIRTYSEYHHTVSDWVRAHAQADLELLDVIEPEWPEDTPTWGQWSQLRGSIFPGTAIFLSRAR